MDKSRRDERSAPYGRGIPRDHGASPAFHRTYGRPSGEIIAVIFAQLPFAGNATIVALARQAFRILVNLADCAHGRPCPAHDTSGASPEELHPVASARQSPFPRRRVGTRSEAGRENFRPGARSHHVDERHDRAAGKRRVGNPSAPVAGNELDRTVGMNARDEADMGGVADPGGDDGEGPDLRLAEAPSVAEGGRGHSVGERPMAGSLEDIGGEMRAPGAALAGHVARAEPALGFRDHVPAARRRFGARRRSRRHRSVAGDGSEAGEDGGERPAASAAPERVNAASMAEIVVRAFKPILLR